MGPHVPARGTPGAEGPPETVGRWSRLLAQALVDSQASPSLQLVQKVRRVLAPKNLSRLVRAAGSSLPTSSQQPPLPPPAPTHFSPSVAFCPASAAAARLPAPAWPRGGPEPGRLFYQFPIASPEPSEGSCSSFFPPSLPSTAWTRLPRGPVWGTGLELPEGAGGVALHGTGSIVPLDEAEGAPESGSPPADSAQEPEGPCPLR